MPRPSVLNDMRHVRLGSWLALLVVVAFGLRIGYCAVSGHLGGTRGGYQEFSIAGRRLLEHGTIVSPLIKDDSRREPASLLPPAYVAMVAGVYRIWGPGTLAATLILQAINAAATSLAVIPVFAVARRLGGQRAAWPAAVLVVVNPALIGFTDLIWDTSLFTLGVSLTVWMALRLSFRRTGWWQWSGFGLVLGGLAWLNPALTISYPILVLWPLSKTHGWRLRPMLLGIAATVCGWLIAIAPWTVRNYVHFGELMYIRGGLGLELWLGVCPETDTHGAAVYKVRYPLTNAREQERVTAMGERAYVEECKERAAAAIRADPRRFLRLIAWRAVDYWAGTLYTHASPGGGGWPRRASRAAVAIVLAAEVGVILACLIIIAVRQRTTVCPSLLPDRIDRSGDRPGGEGSHRLDPARSSRLNEMDQRAGGDLGWLLALVVLFSLVYCLTHVVVRFRTAIEPVILILVAVLVVKAFGRGGLARSDRDPRPCR